MVAVAMPKGLKVSIKFTPQAKDDYLYFDENSGGTGYDYGTDDLLANDDAANAARVWGIFAQSETEVQNNIGTLVSNTQPNGDSAFTIGGADGVQVSYDAETGDIVFEFDPADFDYLADGESADVGAFTYVIRMSNGAFSTAIAHIVVNGTNDEPVITVEDGDSDAESLTETDAALSKSGTLTVTDADLSDTVTVSVKSATVGGDYTNGWLEADVLPFFKIGTPGPLDADPGDAKNISWSFDSDPEAFNFLQKDEKLILTYTVEATDSFGASTTHDVTIAITGTEDAAVITDDPDTANDFKVVEDSDSTAGGKLLVTDADHDQSAFQAVLLADLAGDYGDFTFDETTGAWTYTLRNGDGNVQALTATDHVTDTLTVQSIDGTTHDIVVKIDGADEPVTTATLPPTYTGTGDPNDNDGSGASGSQTINDGNSNVARYGGAGDDTLNGENGTDTLYGGSGNDTISGGNSPDTLYGGSGNDVISGDSGNADVYGGYGADTITGGAATDTIHFLDLLDTNDVINGFVSGADKLDLSAIDADTSDGDNDAFGWGGQQAGATVVANSVTWYTDGTNVYLLADTNGNLANAEFAVTLNGITSIQQTDFNTL